MRHYKLIAAVASLVVLALFPLLFSNPAITTIAVFTLLFATAAVGWNIFSGYTGYISIGHAAFYGLGAYFLALFCAIWHVPAGWPPFLLLPLVGLLTGLCALPIGWVIRKANNRLFLVFTIAIFVLCSQLPDFLTNTPLGGAEVSLPIPLWSADVFNLPFYYTGLLLLVIATFSSWSIYRSRFGLILRAIRDDEDRSWGMGVRTELYKVSAFVISAIFVGIVGAENAYFLGFVSAPSAFDKTMNIFFPLLTFFGGIGTLVGPLIGAIIATPLQQYLTLQFGTLGLDLILYGVLFLLVIRLLPQGILPTVQSRWPQWANFLLTWGAERGIITTNKTTVSIALPTGNTSMITNQSNLITPISSLSNPWHTTYSGQIHEESSDYASFDIALATPLPQSQVEGRFIEVEQVLEATFSLLPDTPSMLYTPEIPPSLQKQVLMKTAKIETPRRPTLSEKLDVSQSSQKLRAIKLTKMNHKLPVVSGSGKRVALPNQQTVHVANSVSSPSVPISVNIPNPPSITSLPIEDEVCPRCNHPLRVLRTMVFCRKCGLIMSREEA